MMSFGVTLVRPIVPDATKVSAGIFLPDTCAALALAIGVATLLCTARGADVEHAVAILVGRTLRFVIVEALARFGH